MGSSYFICPELLRAILHPIYFKPITIQTTQATTPSELHQKIEEFERAQYQKWQESQHGQEVNQTRNNDFQNYQHTRDQKN